MSTYRLIQYAFVAVVVMIAAHLLVSGSWAAGIPAEGAIAPASQAGATASPSGEGVMAPDEALRAKVRNLLDQIAPLIQARERNDCLALAEAIGTSTSLLDRITLGALVARGLPDDLLDRYDEAAFKKEAPGINSARGAIVAWAKRQSARLKPISIAPEVLQRESAFILLGEWGCYLRYGLGTEEMARDYVEALVILPEILTEKGDRESIAYMLTRAVDEDDMKAELKMGRPTLPFAEPPDKVLAIMKPWIRENFPYFYLQPGERTLKLDREAREHKKPSAEYRKTHPWKAKEGPNVTDPAKKTMM